MIIYMLRYSNVIQTLIRMLNLNSKVLTAYAFEFHNEAYHVLNRKKSGKTNLVKMQQHESIIFHIFFPIIIH